ncbi:MAG: PaaI family thioesterase [Pseudomonadota bacterium]|nr:PaaI family thioesterase [Pseudomonadota bacterium]
MTPDFAARIVAEPRNPDFREDGVRRLALHPIFRAIGLSVVSLEPGQAVIEIPLTDSQEGPEGHFAAGSVGTLGDVAAMHSVLTLQPKNTRMATLDFTVKMCAPAKGVQLRAVGRVMQLGRSTSVGAADVYAVDADGTATLCGAVLATGRVYLPRETGPREAGAEEAAA